MITKKTYIFTLLDCPEDIGDSNGFSIVSAGCYLNIGNSHFSSSEGYFGCLVRKSASTLDYHVRMIKQIKYQFLTLEL